MQTGISFIIRESDERTLHTIVVGGVLYHYIYESGNASDMQRLNMLIENLQGITESVTKGNLFKCGHSHKRVCQFSIDKSGHFLQIVVNDSPQYVFIEKKTVFKKELVNLTKSLVQLRNKLT
jgi:hypothetical protein